MKDEDIHDSFEDATAWYIAQQMHTEVSITGGEPLLALPRIVMFSQIIRYFNPDVKLWLYTNGELLTMNELQVLKAIGIDGLNVSLHKGLHHGWEADLRWASMMFPMRYLINEDELNYYGRARVFDLPGTVRVWSMDDCKDMPFESRYRLKDPDMRWS
jgi:organic radical activating enzyme